LSLAWKRAKAYLRLTVTIGAAVAVGLVLFNNRGRTVSFWFFGLTEGPINVVWLVLCTVAGTLVCYGVFQFGRGLLRDLRELKRLGAIDQVAKDQARRAEELNQRERLIDEKAKQAVHSNKDEVMEQTMEPFPREGEI